MSQVCSITHEPMQHPAFVIPCGHRFERQAIEDWHAINPTCPIDRVRIEGISSVVRSSVPQASVLSEPGRTIRLSQDKGRRFQKLVENCVLVNALHNPQVLENPVTKKQLYQSLMSKVSQTGQVFFSNDELYQFRWEVTKHATLGKAEESKMNSDFKDTGNTNRFWVVEQSLKRAAQPIHA